MDYFKRDAKGFISPKALSHPDKFFGCAVFTLATIQQSFFTVPLIMKKIREEGVESRFLFGAKRAGYEFASENRRMLLKEAQAFVKGQMGLESIILRFMEIPGLGLAKASFLVQLTCADGACLDRHNLRYLGLGDNFAKTPKELKPVSLLRRAEVYNKTWRKHGNSGFWWNSWCDHVATKYPKKFANGAEVSALHRIAVL